MWSNKRLFLASIFPSKNRMHVSSEFSRKARTRTSIAPFENLGTLVRQHTPSARIAVIDPASGTTPRILSYDMLQRMIDSAAQRIEEMRLSREQRVGILAYNSVEYLALYFAVMTAGLTCVPLNIKLAKKTLVGILNDADVSLLFRDSANEFPVPDHITCERIETDPETVFWRHYFATPGELRPHRFKEGEDGFFLYTSGSTGIPKGVPLSHSGQHWALRQLHPARDEIRQHRCLIAAPLYHMNGLWNAKVSLEMGGQSVLLPKFDVASYARAIVEHQCTWLTSVPTMLAMLVREKEITRSLDFSHVTRVTMGSAPITQALWDDVQVLFSNARLFNGYGTTEHGAAAFGEHPDGLARPPLSVGYPTPDTEVELRCGETNAEGTLFVKGPANARGYHNRRDSTAEKFADGWYNTGDVMRRDADGFYFFGGRCDDMFNCGGENIYPGELESLLEKHPKIRQACVVPMDYGDKGQAPFAFVVLAKSSVITEKDVKDYALKNGPPYMHPRRVSFLEELPLIGTNKVDRTSLRTLADSIQQGSV